MAQEPRVPVVGRGSVSSRTVRACSRECSVHCSLQRGVTAGSVLEGEAGAWNEADAS
jgi:hypothetical protein